MEISFREKQSGITMAKSGPCCKPTTRGLSAQAGAGNAFSWTADILVAQNSPKVDLINPSSDEK